ncbi:MAG TPA: hypothetical protein VI011_05810 [Asanoa sp.]
MEVEISVSAAVADGVGDEFVDGDDEVVSGRACQAGGADVRGDEGPHAAQVRRPEPGADEGARSA